MVKRINPPAPQIQAGDRVEVTTSDLQHGQCVAIAGDRESGGRIWVYLDIIDEWRLECAERVWGLA